MCCIFKNNSGILTQGATAVECCFSFPLWQAIYYINLILKTKYAPQFFNDRCIKCDTYKVLVV